MPGSFADSNVVLYLASDDARRGRQAAAILASGVVVSVQVLNETANVMRRKWQRPWDDIVGFLAELRAIAKVRDVDLATHERGLGIAQRYRLQLHDSMIVAAALLADCDTLYSEDMQHGLLVEDRLRIVDPFRAP